MAAWGDAVLVIVGRTTKVSVLAFLAEIYMLTSTLIIEIRYM